MNDIFVCDGQSIQMQHKDVVFTLWKYPNGFYGSVNSWHENEQCCPLLGDKYNDLDGSTAISHMKSIIDMTLDEQFQTGAGIDEAQYDPID